MIYYFDAIFCLETYNTFIFSVLKQELFYSYGTMILIDRFQFLKHHYLLYDCAMPTDVETKEHFTSLNQTFCFSLCHYGNNICPSVIITNLKSYMVATIFMLHQSQYFPKIKHIREVNDYYFQHCVNWVILQWYIISKWKMAASFNCIKSSFVKFGIMEIFMKWNYLYIILECISIWQYVCWEKG
jgi:hypothetical protein